MSIKKVSIILVIIGLLVGLSPVAGQLYTKYRESRMIDEWMNSEDSETAEEAAAADPEAAYSGLQEVLAPKGDKPEETAVETAAPGATQAAESAADRPTDAAEPEKPPANQKVLGIIRIDKIKVSAPIVEGVSASNLKAGIGHIPGTAGLGNPGNCALAGHRSYTFGKFFNRLDELEIGDEILITTKKEQLKYKVYEKLVVQPEDVSVIKGSKDENIVTLITCTPIYVASHRLIIHASFEERSAK